MNKKQTAVEWLINEIESKGNAWENVSIRRLQISIDVSDYFDLKSKAKAMEKEQIIDAHFDGQHCNEWGNIPAEKFYNETYGGK